MSTTVGDIEKHGGLDVIPEGLEELHETLGDRPRFSSNIHLHHHQLSTNQHSPAPHGKFSKFNLCLHY